MSEVARILKEADDLLTPETWTQGTVAREEVTEIYEEVVYSRPAWWRIDNIDQIETKVERREVTGWRPCDAASSRAKQWCAIGAIIRVEGGAVTPSDIVYRTEEANRAASLLQDAARQVLAEHDAVWVGQRLQRRAQDAVVVVNDDLGYDDTKRMFQIAIQHALDIEAGL